MIINPARHARDAEKKGPKQMPAIDFSVEAELFSPRSRKLSGRQFRYKRFASTAEAIRFAIEELPADILAGAVIEAEEDRYDARAIRRLYESAEYPLVRRAAVHSAKA